MTFQRGGNHRQEQRLNADLLNVEMIRLEHVMLKPC